MTLRPRFDPNRAARHRRARIGMVVFQLATLVGIVVLMALLYNIINNAFGLAAIEYRIYPGLLGLDLETLQVEPELHYSLPYEALLRLYWIGKLHDRVGLSLGATGGIHGAEEALKLLLAGARVVHQCSILLQKGPQALADTLAGIVEWMEEKEYESMQQLIGSSCHNRAVNPEAWDRINYIRTLRG